MALRFPAIVVTNHVTQIIVTNQFLVKSSEGEPAASRGLSLANDLSQREMLLTSQEAALPMVTPLLLLPGFCWGGPIVLTRLGGEGPSVCRLEM